MLGIRKVDAKPSDGSQDPRNADPLNTEGLSPSEIAFYAALQRAFLTDLNKTVLNSTTLLQNLAQNYGPQEKFEEIEAGQPIHFINKINKNVFAVTKDEIKFIDGNSTFSFADAMDMAKFAALDISMQRDGITLEGSKKERALLQIAIEKINESLPNDNQLTIHNKMNPIISAFALYKARKESTSYINAENTIFSKQPSEEPETPTTNGTVTEPNTPNENGGRSVNEPGGNGFSNDGTIPAKSKQTPSNPVGNSSAGGTDCGEVFENVSDPEGTLPERKKNDPNIEETKLNIIQTKIIENHELGHSISRKNIGALLSPDDYQGSRERAITAVARWLVNNDTLINIQHGNSPITTRQLNPDNGRVNAIKQQLEKIKEREKATGANTRKKPSANKDQFGNATNEPSDDKLTKQSRKRTSTSPESAPS